MEKTLAAIGEIGYDQFQAAWFKALRGTRNRTYFEEDTMSRKASIERTTKETQIRLSLDLDGKGCSKVCTSVPFLDHMLDLFTRHGLFDHGG